MQVCLAMSTLVGIALPSGCEAYTRDCATSTVPAFAPRKRVVTASRASAVLFAKDSPLNAATISLCTRLSRVVTRLKQLRIVAVFHDDALDLVQRVLQRF